MKKETIEIKFSKDIIAARQAGRNMARELGFSPVDETRLAAAISELTRNVIQHAGEGVCVITDQSTNNNSKVQVKVEDNGPGIADIDQAMIFGFSTTKGLGAGLPGTKRLVHEFSIDSKPGHTQVTIAIIKK